MNVSKTDKGKRTDKLLVTTRQCASGCYAIIITLNKNIISRFHLLCLSAEYTNLISVSYDIGERSNT